MLQSRKFWLTWLLAGIMLISSAFCAFADDEVGPFFDPAYNPDLRDEAYYESLEETGEGQETPGPDTETGTAADTQTGTQEGGTDTAQTVEPQPEEPQLTVPNRMPRLQATTLLCDSHTWSQAFVNDQWCDVEGRPFYSISIFLENIIGNIHYRAYTSSNGWTNWAMNGQQTDIPADFAPIEAIQLRFSGVVQDKYDIYYTTRLSDGRETGWGKNGTTAGAMNQGLTLSAFRMAFFNRGEEVDLPLTDTVVSAHADGIQYIDGAMRYIHGDGSNYTGWGWVEGQRYYFVDSVPVTGWQYIDGYKYYFAEDGKLVDDLRPIIGAQGSYHIQINKEMNCMTIFAQDGGNGYIIPVVSFLTSTGDDTPLGTFHTPEKYRWRLMIHGLYTQYATRLGAGLPILMHSVIYDAPNPFTLQSDSYNYMGVARSSGCIRLVTEDCKWIYDNCPLGTSVTVYNSPICGPYERPTIPAEIAAVQTWDPTDTSITQEQIAAETARLLSLQQ